MNMIILGTSVASVIKKSIVSNTDNIDIQMFGSINEFAKTAEMRHVPCDRLIITQEVLVGSNLQEKKSNLQQLYLFLESKYSDIVIITVTKDVEDMKMCGEVFYSPVCVNLCLASKIKPAALQRLGVSTVDELNEFFADSTIAGYQRKEAEELREKVNTLESEGDFAIADEFSDLPPEEPTVPQKQGIFGGFGKKKESSPDSSAFLGDFGDEPMPISNTNDFSGFESSGFDEEVGGLDFGADDGFDSPDSAVGDLDFGGDETVGSMDFGGDAGFEPGDDFGSGDDFAPGDDFEPDDGFSEVTEPEESVDAFDFSDIEDDSDSGFEDEFDDEFSEFDSGVTVEQPVAAPPPAPARKPSMRPAANPPKSLAKKPAPTQPADDLDLSDLSAYQSPVKQQPKTSPLKRVQSRVTTQQQMTVQAGVSRYQNIMNGNLSAVIVMTGERRTGVTKSALNVASLFSKAVPTLFVDLDTARHGSLYYLGLEDLSDSDTAVQNGLGLIKSGRDIKRYVYRSLNFKFDSLLSMPGNTISDADLTETISQLIFQSSVYNMIVVDCPLSNLYLVEELMYSADFFICTCSDICACSNLLFKLDNLQMSKAAAGKGISDKALALLHNRAKYIVNVTESTNEIISNMQYLERLYCLSDDKFVWTQLPYAGTVDNIEAIMQNLM